MIGENEDKIYNTKKYFYNAWVAIFQISSLNLDIYKPIQPYQLENPNSDLVKSILKIYTMESFIVYRLN